MLLSLWTVGAHATASNKELEARANEMDARLMAVERANERLVELQQQIETARQDMRALRGRSRKHGTNWKACESSSATSMRTSTVGCC